MAFPLLLPVAAAAAAGAVGILAWQQEKKRKEALRSWAADRGWAYSERDDRQIQRRGTPFDRGRSKRATNVMAGQLAGRQITAFDYRFVTDSGSGQNRSSTTHHYWVMCVRLPTWLPTLEITHENVLDKLGDVFGFSDIELESEDFNRRFRVNAQDRKFAYDVLHARTMTALLAQPEVILRIQGSEVLTWSKGKLDPSSLDAAMAPISVLLDGIPDYVWDDHGVRR